MTVPDQSAATLKKLLLIKRRPHMTHRATTARLDAELRRKQLWNSWPPAALLSQGVPLSNCVHEPK
jgi:hypothetical protein